MAEPLVGAVMRDRIFRSVDLPAPFAPMIPSVMPQGTSKSMLSRAQNVRDSATGPFLIRSKAETIASHILEKAREPFPPRQAIAIRY